MGYPTKGENHHSGIKNEKDIVLHQNQNPDNAINNRIKTDNNTSQIVKWEHRGGTQLKEDAVAIIDNKHLGISIKNHKEGSFDWINTTKNVPKELKECIIAFKEKNKDKDVTTELREEVSDIINTYLETIDPQIISDLLNDIYDKYPPYILINIQNDNKFIMFSRENLKQLFNRNNSFILKKTRAKSSRQLWLKSENGEINTNLRIRITLNNGVNALLGKSKSNKSSTPSIKIQQDNVDKFIESCLDKTTYLY